MSIVIITTIFSLAAAAIILLVSAFLQLNVFVMMAFGTVFCVTANVLALPYLLNGEKSKR